MKRLFIIFVAGSLFACNAEEKKTSETAQSANAQTTEHTAKVDPANVTTIQWIDPQVKDMGKITEGQEVEISWRVKNTGNVPLVITNVTAQCGCTIPETPKEPIAPGDETIIKAKFNSNGRGGTTNTKEVYVDANTNPVRTVLTFNVEVLKKG